MRDVWTRLHWPQVTVLAIFAASVVAALWLTPPETIDRVAALDWRAIASVVVGVCSALAGIFGGPVVRPKEDQSVRLTSLPPLPLPSMPPSIPPKDGEQ